MCSRAVGNNLHDQAVLHAPGEPGVQVFGGLFHVGLRDNVARSNLGMTNRQGAASEGGTKRGQEQLADSVCALHGWYLVLVLLVEFKHDANHLAYRRLLVTAILLGEKLQASPALLTQFDHGHNTSDHGLGRTAKYRFL